MSPFETSQLHTFFSKILSPPPVHPRHVPEAKPPQDPGDKYFRGEGPKIGATGY